MEALRRGAAWLRETLVVGPIRLYQKHISPGRQATCRFTPTCSAYTIGAVRRFGVIRGGVMALCRILRCNPFCRGGVDPVPGRFTLRPFAGREEDLSDHTALEE